jgi:hypothetical protein
MITEGYTLPEITAHVISIGTGGHPDKTKSPRIATPGALILYIRQETA